jgi:NIMA (never in mitosis gene a)-related kinase
MNQFQIVAKIGEGAYSTVYTVRRIDDNQLYALKKVMLKKLSEKEKQNALNEVRILASVKSPYVISYKESFIDEIDQTLCIVMEYADEGDLFQKITLYKKLKTRFDEIDIWKIFLQITKGLHDLHSYNILHRDMKSANVFLFRDGSAKLGDLNVSKITSRGLGCTQTGTPYYASPEVWKDNPYDLKSDIWSLGCVCYEMIMLKTPFRADTMEGLYRKIMKCEYPKISNNYSKELSFVITNMLCVKAEDRPNTQEILNFPEVKKKIEEYNLFPEERQYSYKVKNKMRTRIQSGTSNNYDLKTIPSQSEINISKDSIRNLRYSGKNKNNILEEKEHKQNFVIDTIKMTKRLKLLNKHLPESNYESDKENYNDKINNISFPNLKLPLLKISNNNNKSIEIENVKDYMEKNRTIKFKIKKKNNLIDYRKSIDMIIEEEEYHPKKFKEPPIKTKSLCKMKDLRLLYPPYIPKIYSESKSMKYNISEENIFGNLNYSISRDLLNKGRRVNDYSFISHNISPKSRPIKLIPILRFKKK